MDLIVLSTFEGLIHYTCWWLLPCVAVQALLNHLIINQIFLDSFSANNLPTSGFLIQSLYELKRIVIFIEIWILFASQFFWNSLALHLFFCHGLQHQLYRIWQSLIADLYGSNFHRLAKIDLPLPIFPPPHFISKISIH